MPIPNAPTHMNFDDAPGEGLSLDEIFSDLTPKQDDQTTLPPVVIDPVVETFLETSTGTVYKTANDAVKGIEHKDALIAQLRQELEQKTGQDPLKKQPVVQDDPNLVSYVENPERYLEDLDAMMKKGDKRGTVDVVNKLIQDNLRPYAPAISNMVRNQTVEAVASEVPEFVKFMASDEYQQTLDAYPLLKTSIVQAENLPQASQELAQLYKMAYDASNGRNLPKIVQGDKSNNVAQVRPTVSSTTIAPPHTQEAKTVQPGFTSPEARKALIEQQENSGVSNLRF